MMLGDLVKPIDTLINRGSDGIAAFLKPWHMKRIARADIEIEQMKAAADVKGKSLSSEIQRDVVRRRIWELSNLHNISIEARPHIGPEDYIESLNSDFKQDFVDNAETESDEYIQKLWGRLLAGEMKESGLFDKRCLRFVGSLSHAEAKNINILLQHCITSQGHTELVLQTSNEGPVSAVGIDVETVRHFEHLGVFSTNQSKKMYLRFDPDAPRQINNVVASSMDGRIAMFASVRQIIKDEKLTGRQFVISKTPLTKLGRQLFRLVDHKKNRHALRLSFRELKTSNSLGFSISVNRIDNV